MSLPWGDASAESGDELAARNGLLVPLILDAGFKLSKPVFLGIYAGVAYGSAGNDPRASELCESEGVDCSVLAYQLGLQGQYQFGASERYNPWVGYGFGYEIVRQSLSSEGYDETQTSGGVTFLKAGIGVDFRGPIAGGPFVEISAGRFDSASTEIDDTAVHEGPVDEGAWHGYLTVGLRVVVFP